MELFPKSKKTQRGLLLTTIFVIIMAINNFIILKFNRLLYQDIQIGNILIYLILFILIARMKEEKIK